eukprot:GHVQ01039606.1.p1 GENE.GHVQ01039606.1~~GHVQ01039606.1.p1  ORF type:complete len:171 (+),score=9.92 GHVQ01039606.1:67-513(+)
MAELEAIRDAVHYPGTRAAHTVTIYTDPKKALTDVSEYDVSEYLPSTEASRQIQERIKTLHANLTNFLMVSRTQRTSTERSRRPSRQRRDVPSASAQIEKDEAVTTNTALQDHTHNHSRKLRQSDHKQPSRNLRQAVPPIQTVPAHPP